MTQEAYTIWRPEYSGHIPPNWREGMKWSVIGSFPAQQFADPLWKRFKEYRVPLEALNSPNDDAGDDVEAWKQGDASIDCRLLNICRELRTQWAPEELAKHGITLAPEEDWATELSEGLRELYLYDRRNAAIALIRERVVLKGEG